jgi:exonuclease III
MINKETDIIILSELRTTANMLNQTKLKWALKPTHFSLHPEARAGVAIYVYQTWAQNHSRE